MMYLLHRFLIRGYVKAYFICLVSLLTLYVVVDLFTNLDEFTDHRTTTSRAPVVHIGTYYGYKVTQIFDRLSEAIVLLAATFTVALIAQQRVLPLLSAGVPTRRVVLPILLTAVVMLGLSVVNQELVIAQIGDKLVNDKSDPSGDKELLAKGAYEPDGTHIEGRLASRKEGDQEVVCDHSRAGGRLPREHQRGEGLLQAPAKRAKNTAAAGCSPKRSRSGSPASTTRTWKCSIPASSSWTKNVDFEALTHIPTWYTFVSTMRIFGDCTKANRHTGDDGGGLPHEAHSSAARVHSGAPRPVRHPPRSEPQRIHRAGLCLLLCALFFAAQFACKSLGDGDYLSPALAAWLPVLVFGPLSVVMFDAIHT